MPTPERQTCPLAFFADYHLSSVGLALRKASYRNFGHVKVPKCHQKHVHRQQKHRSPALSLDTYEKAQVCLWICTCQRIHKYDAVSRKHFSRIRFVHRTSIRHLHKRHGFEHQRLAMGSSDTDRAQYLTEIRCVQAYDVVHIVSSPRTMLQNHRDKARLKRPTPQSARHGSLADD